DGSVAAVSDFASRHAGVDISLFVNESNRGISHNYTNAAFLGRGEFFCRVGGHFQDRRDAILPLVQRMGEADVVLGYLADDQRSFGRRVISRVFTVLVNAFSGYSIPYYLGVVIYRETHRYPASRDSLIHH